MPSDDIRVNVTGALTFESKVARDSLPNGVDFDSLKVHSKQERKRGYWVDGRGIRRIIKGALELSSLSSLTYTHPPG